MPKAAKSGFALQKLIQDDFDACDEVRIDGDPSVSVPPPYMYRDRDPNSGRNWNIHLMGLPPHCRARIEKTIARVGARFDLQKD